MARDREIDLPPGADVIVPVEPLEGGGARGIHVHEGRVDGCTMRESIDGRPIGPRDTIARVRPRPGFPGAYDVVEILYDAACGSAPSSAETRGTLAEEGDEPRKGPARVVSDAYRTGWDAIDWNAGRQGKDSHGAN